MSGLLYSSSLPPLGITILLSFYLAGTLARPVLRLAAAAERVRRGLGRGSDEIPDFTERGDEIGELSGVLREMTSALHERMDAIERFAADVSHEIKNPLTSLRSAVETAARVSDPEQQQKLMAIIQEDVQRLDRLITDISNASRIDSNSAEPRPRRSTSRVCSQLFTKSMRPVIPKRKSLPVSESVSASRRLRIEVQVFRTPQNAISFSHLCRVTLLARRESDIEIDVCDDGPGLPEGKLDAVFNRFYTERPEGEKFGTHSGLGLSISKQIVEAHGGSIRAENRYTLDRTVRGARFIVRLPLSDN